MKRFLNYSFAVTLLLSVFAVAAIGQKPNIRRTGSNASQGFSTDTAARFTFTTDSLYIDNTPGAGSIFDNGAFWSVAGDLRIVSGANSPEVTISNKNKNPNYDDEAYGKGVLSLNYNRQLCGDLQNL